MFSRKWAEVNNITARCKCDTFRRRAQRPCLRKNKILFWETAALGKKDLMVTADKSH